jgi:two-component system, NtrC family, sensor kinase
MTTPASLPTASRSSVPAPTNVAPAAVPPRRIARELATGFAAVSLVSVAVFILLLGLLNQVSGLVMGMREEEDAIRVGLELSTAVREQYIHVAHSLIESDHSHMLHYDAARERVRTGSDRLAPYVPEQERWRLAALRDETERLAELFTGTTLPAAERGDWAQVVMQHRALITLAEDASTQADALARAVESRMAHSHVQATRATSLGLIGGGVGVAVVLALAIGFTLRLRREVLEPLRQLTEAARRFGAGAFDTRVGAVGRGELLELSQAFERMLEELAERQRRLVDNERMAAIGHLAAGVAHELNNPIGIIRGYLKTMDARDDPDTLAEELGILDEEARHCQRIAEDLLAYARPRELALERIELGVFIEETLRRFCESPAAGGARLDIAIEPFVLEADATRLRQVLHNLVLNAVQASDGPADIEVTGRVEAGGYRIDVADRGPGVAAQDRGRIFEPFYSRRKGGSGLGLSVCQGIVRAHGGSIEVCAREGGGSVFVVRLPAAPAREPWKEAS